MAKNNQNHTGSGDNVGRDRIINNTILINSLDYKELTESITGQKKLLKYIPESEISERIEVSKKLNQLEKQLESFKENVFALYKIFNEVELTGERLKQAKVHFDKGEFREADAILKTKEITGDLDKLLKREKGLNKEKDKIQKKREQIADELMIKAELWQTFYHEIDWFEKTIFLYKKALFATRRPENVFRYAFFLQKHHQNNEAIVLYRQISNLFWDLSKEKPMKYLPYLGNTLNNLAGLQYKPKENYKKALYIYRRLYKKGSNPYLSDIAIVLNNSAVYQTPIKCVENLRLALRIRKCLAKKKPQVYLSHVAATLNNLGNVQAKEELLSEALDIYRDLGEYYLSSIASTLNNLAKVQNEKENFSDALKNTEEALDNYKVLAKKNPNAYLPYVAEVMINMSTFYLYSKPDKKKSINLAKKVIEIANKIPQIRIVQEFANKAKRIVQVWKEM